MIEDNYQLTKRFGVSLVANIVRSAIVFVTGMLLARWMGPDYYGRMVFLLASFVAIKHLLDMYSTSAFFTFLSQKNRSKKFISYYWKWVLVQLLVALMLVLVILPDTIIASIWLGESEIILVLALIATFMQQHIWSIALQMAEANRKTIRVQILNAFIVCIHLIAVIILWVGGKLFIPIIFIAIIIEWSIASWLAYRMYFTKDIPISNAQNSEDTLKSTFMEFWTYCYPLIPYVWIGFAYEFLDRWMLQIWGGPTEQAYFSVGQLISAASLLATTSILKIFWKEIAEAKYKKNNERMYSLYKKVSRGLFFVGVLIAGSLVPWVSEIINFFLGPEYLGGSLTLMIMLFYPAHQALGQINQATLYSTENTKILVIVGSIFMLISIVVVYFMLAPKTMYIPGFDLGSKGLAIKLVVLQIVEVNIIAYLVSKLFNWKFYFFYQIILLLFVVIFSWLSKILVSYFFLDNFLINFTISTFIYLTLMFASLIIFPSIIGLDRSLIVDNIKDLSSKIGRIKLLFFKK